ncbi:GNAT family N-acetyltransferase [Halorussus caseinilyticus]|uniref:GNAT family N-acetyltransferase n=1 Tax=Halorussus caseinilyticus TaxID=3034025 RepID=UPI0023E89989|nr:GNAT family N-acetyltransferase [Halorussus sp. DT72]
MELVEYTPEFEADWNEFVARSKNATFMFNRGYMEYHSDRFEDKSLICYYKNDPIALFPANVTENEMISHGGLTFGGFLTSNRVKTPKIMELFEELTTYAERQGLERIIYKCIPYIYHNYPASEDRYGLFRHDAHLTRRDVTTVISRPNHPEFQKNRRRKIADAEDAGLQVRESTDFETYWDILEINLDEEHDVEPVHTLEEIELLHDRFPDNIRLIASFEEGQMVGGVVIYQSEQVARTQYIANSNRGREVGALDIVFDRLIHGNLISTEYLDLGISTEDAGRYLNEGLVFFKEGFGGRGVVHDFYEIPIGTY